MKVNKTIPEPVFHPITITLETEEEAQMMWCSLASWYSSTRDHMIDKKLNTSRMIDLSVRMHYQFEQVYPLI